MPLGWPDTAHGSVVLDVYWCSVPFLHCWFFGAASATEAISNYLTRQNSKQVERVREGNASSWINCVFLNRTSLSVWKCRLWIQPDLSNWSWSCGLCVFQNYSWMMKIASSSAGLLIPNILRQNVPMVNLGLYEKGLPWLELRWPTVSLGTSQFLHGGVNFYFSLPHQISL